jgi:lipid-A-disaccharide synthase-like uncharacterized protein
MSFMTHWYLTALEHPYDTLWTAVGFLGQAIFGVRFVIQWVSSEREGRSVIPIAFWYCSLVGCLLSLAYIIHKGEWVLLMSQALPLPIYARNIWMIYRDRRALAVK